MKESGKKRDFPFGAVRDSAEGKPRMELIPYDLLLLRLAPWYAEGAEKYGDNNWRKGQPNSVLLGSLMRHLTKWLMGMKDEDHLAAVVWNALGLLNNDQYMKDNPVISDTSDWFENEKPTGEGTYLQKKGE